MVPAFLELLATLVLQSFHLDHYLQTCPLVQKLRVDHVFLVSRGVLEGQGLLACLDLQAYPLDLGLPVDLCLLIVPWVPLAHRDQAFHDHQVRLVLQ